MGYAETFEVIVIGGGHAGTEAALASARMGRRTLLLTQSIETLGQMSCNPAFGGIGKGHLVREIDALGGAMARAVDRAGIQFRTLNASKGPAVRATRAQADRLLYRKAIRTLLENQPNLSIFQQEAADLVVENGRVRGVVTVTGIRFGAPAVVLTVGTFLDNLNPHSLTVIQDARIEPSVASAAHGAHVQFERLGYFCVAPDSTPEHVVFNRTVGLKDSWAKIEKTQA